MEKSLLNTFKRLMLPITVLAVHLCTTPLAASGPASVRLADHVPVKAVNKAVFLNPLDADTHVPITFVLPLRNQNELEELINRLYDPNDQQHYGKYLTSAEFVERFAPTQKDYDKVVAYAKKLGLTVHGTHPNRTLLNVKGAARTIESAFNLHLHHYMLQDGRKFYAPNANPEVPRSIASVISGIVGLDNHALRHTYHHRKEASHSSNTGSNAFPSGPGGGFAPKDLLAAYNLSGVSANGANQVIALFELAGYKLSDIKAYATHFGLPAPKLKNIAVDGGSNSGIDAEVTLDIELAIALAPASTIYVYEGPNSGQGVLDTYNRIATDNIAKQVSSSWGMGEDLSDAQSLKAENAIFQQMAAQGQTIYAAAGDSGAYDDYDNNSSKTLVVDDPAAQPYVVGVGGTRLTVNSQTGAYSTESVWNEGLGRGAGGGGVSSVWAIPSWQANVATVYSKTHRNVPDVALNADTASGYAIYYNGQWQIYGGTSCAAPLWAAFTARINQELATAQQPSLGFANPKLYAIGTGMAYTTDFHDVTTGNNLYYAAQVGYDNASGWGSFNGANLYASLTKNSPKTSVFNMIMKHNGSFTKGETGTYRIVVSNNGGSSTSSPVTVALNLPNGLSYNSFSGSGWTFNQNTLTFTQNSPLNSNSNYPTIVLSVNVAQNAPSKVTPTATLSVDGSTVKTVSNLTTTR
jgi:kumamolisin